jgi:hypothetical protein
LQLGEWKEVVWMEINKIEGFVHQI